MEAVYHWVGVAVVWGAGLAVGWLLFRKQTVAVKFRGIGAILNARRCIVLTYDERNPPTLLGEIHFCGAPSWEIPERLANACLVAVEYDKLVTQEGQDEALKIANEILMRPRYGRPSPG